MTTSKTPGRKTGKKSREKLLTDKEVSALKPGKWLSDPAPRGAGQLQVRGLASGRVYYFVYTTSDGSQDRLRIGADLNLADARVEAGKLSRRYQSGDKDLRAALEADEREQQRLADAAQAAKDAKGNSTLGHLLTAYADHLMAQNKPSARSVRGALNRHVRDEWLDLWRKPAVDVVLDDLLPVIRRLSTEGKRREASKLRSYLISAFTAAIHARQSVDGGDVIESLASLKISTNPAKDIAPLKGASNPRKVAMTIEEIRAYWRRIEALDTTGGAALRFHLLSGGQRIQQLARLQRTDFDHDDVGVHMIDPKGRRADPRKHFVPLIPAAVDAMNAMLKGDTGPHLFSLTGGESALSYESLRDHFVEVRAAMLAAGELSQGKVQFSVGLIRASVETNLSREGVGKEHLAQLLSHGVSGIQSASYNHHDFLREKREALEVLFRLLTSPGATVTPIRKGKAATK
jgi:hypothetical protein